MIIIINNRSKSTKTVFNFDTLLKVVYINGNKYNQKKYSSPEDLEYAVKVDEQRCMKRSFDYTKETK